MAPVTLAAPVDPAPAPIPEQVVPPEPEAVAADQFRAAMRHLAASVVVVTVAEGPTGFTASSLTSVSLDPPLVSFCVDRRAGSARAVGDAPFFAVNVLGEGQAALADRFARPGDRFAAPTRWSPGPYGVPLLHGVAARLVCARYRVVPLGDHLLVAGLVLQAVDGTGEPPLLYRDRRYGGFRAG
jgi:flavin reductase (DIM6/NTAB) family NADH-FMN oxidoreductase RutF